MSTIFHVLLTGGVGSRLWPLSRQSRPKQYLQLFSELSLFELAVKRNAAFSDGLIVVGNGGTKNLSAQGLQKLNITDYLDIVEATPRNTAPATAFAAFASQANDFLLVTPADLIIAEGDKYSTAVKKAIKLAEKDHLVVLGGIPGNSGIFCFKAGVFLEELKKYAPEVYEKSLKAWKTADENHIKLKDLESIPSVSVDCAVIEKSERVKVVPLEFNWCDIGNFEAVYNILREQGHPVDNAGNMHIGSGKHTSFLGLNDCILISTEDACLVLSKAASQSVKELYLELEKNHLQLIQ